MASDGSEEAFATLASSFLGGFTDSLKAQGVRRVTFMVYINGNITDLPSIFTFRLKNDFGEDSLFRNIEPSYAFQVFRFGLYTSLSRHYHRDPYTLPLPSPSYSYSPSPSPPPPPPPSPYVTPPHQLDLLRLSNFHIKHSDSLQTQMGNVHVYSAMPKKTLAAQAGLKGPLLERFFVRVVAIAPQYQESESERLFVESLNALELKMAE